MGEKVSEGLENIKWDTCFHSSNMVTDKEGWPPSEEQGLLSWPPCDRHSCVLASRRSRSKLARIISHSSGLCYMTTTSGYTVKPSLNLLFISSNYRLDDLTIWCMNTSMRQMCYWHSKIRRGLFVLHWISYDQRWQQNNFHPYDLVLVCLFECHIWYLRRSCIYKTWKHCAPFWHF